MKSIKEYCTQGLTFSEREELYKNTEPIGIGETVYRAGGAFEWTEKIIVDDSNQKIVSLFWNSVYFSSEKDADEMTSKAKAAYDEFMFG